jgi:hypothetical protein
MSVADRQKEFVSYLCAGNPKLGIPGLPLVSACAVTGNATAENQVLPTTMGPKDHGSDASMQWRLNRLDNSANFGREGYKPGLKDWAAAKGLLWDTLQTQAWFLVYETERDFKELYADLAAGAKSLPTLTANFEKYFEMPATLSDLDTRIKYAQDTWKLTHYMFPQAAEAPAPEVPAPMVVPSISTAESDFNAALTKYNAASAALISAKGELKTALDALSKAVNAEVPATANQLVQYPPTLEKTTLTSKG